ncbi:hypothetical protein CEXT_707571 [Caerostris extrusa]|uniref:Uncharacterized protein n=1 Tax=Caerostris extrusa TaxID=172846 RepID=A0AAV4Y965_CAEEX|nr:hypothetical protein CEXT_707571 [Caerostris extrusa]
MVYIRAPENVSGSFSPNIHILTSSRKEEGAETAVIHNDKEQSEESPSEKQQQKEAVSNIADTCEVVKEASNILQEQYFLLKSDEKLLL